MLLRFISCALHRVWTVQSLIVDRTHLVLVSGKLVLQNKTTSVKLFSLYFKIFRVRRRNMPHLPARAHQVSGNDAGGHPRRQGVPLRAGDESQPP